MNCPACSHKKQNKTEVNGVYRCDACGAIHGRCRLGDSYTFVLPYMQADCHPENQCYYDLETIGSNGIERHHGWFDVTTKRVYQVG